MATPTPEQILAYQLRGQPGFNATPDVPLVEGRPDINALYGRLASLQQQAPDYSSLEEISKNRTALGQREFLAGLMLSGKAGASARPLGQALAAQGIETGKPLRVNAADIGYVDPETGAFVEQPLARQAREEKVIQSRIDALTKEREAQARLGIAQYEAQGRTATRENTDQMKQFTTALAAQNALTAESLAAARADYYRNRAAGGDKKRMGLGEQKELKDATKEYTTLDMLTTTFKDSYAGGIGGTPVEEAKGTLARNFPKLAEKVVGKDKVAEERERADWWANQARMDDLPERHAVFGATLTDPEKASWKRASIQRGMDAKDIKKHLETRRNLARLAVERAELFHLENNVLPGAVFALTGHITGSKVETPKPAAPAGGGSFNLSPEEAALVNKWKQ